MDPNKSRELEENKRNSAMMDPIKLKPKILSNDSLDKMQFAFDDQILEEEDDDDDKLPESPLSESFIFINKENLGLGSSRSMVPEFLELNITF